jgi:purine-binding chemotaxis protein CheW
MPDRDERSEASTALRFLTFRVEERSYALPAEDIAEVIRTPLVSQVPQAPKALRGIANLRGDVLPIVSLRGLLGMADRSAEKTGRTIVLDLGSRVGLLVDAVDVLIAIEPDRVEARQAEVGARAGERVVGAFQGQVDGTPTKVLDIKGLLHTAFPQRARTERKSRASIPSSSPIQPAERTVKGDMLVTFEVAGQEFALALEAVQEVLPAPASRMAVPQSDPLVLGITASRGELLPLLSLRGLLGFPLTAAAGAREKVVVVHIAGARVGLVTDRARAIVEAEPECIETIPRVLAARTGGESQVRAVYRGEGGRRLISILAPEQLFREDVMQRLSAHRDQQRPHSPEAIETAQEVLSFVVFRLGDDEFALPIEIVEEVAPVPAQITRLPKTPKFLEGVINLRGTVLPVIDQRRRFDMPTSERSDRRRLLVVRTVQHRAGLIVDSVSDVLRVSAGAIAPAPQLTDDIARLVRGVINLEKFGRMVLVLDPPELLTRGERRLLDSIQTASAQASV